MRDRNRIGCSRQTFGRFWRLWLADLRDAAPDLVVQGGDLAYGGTHSGRRSSDQVFARWGWLGVPRGIRMRCFGRRRALREICSERPPQLGPLLGRIQDLIPPTLAIIGEERLAAGWKDFLRRV